MSTYTGPERTVPLDERQAIVARVLSPSSPLEWGPGGEWAYVTCPGEGSHNNGSGRRDCRVYCIEAPGRTLKPPGCYCLHTSCASVLAEVNRRIRSEIGKAKADVGKGAKSSQNTGSTPGSSPGNASRTPRTADFKAPPRGEATDQTSRTGIPKPLVRFARAQVRTQGPKGADIYPSEASGSCAFEPTEAQPVAVPVIEPEPEATLPEPRAEVHESDDAWAIRTGLEPRPPLTETPPAGENPPEEKPIPLSLYETTPCPRKLDTAFITPTGVERGRWVGGVWVPSQSIPFKK